MVRWWVACSMLGLGLVAGCGGGGDDSMTPVQPSASNCKALTSGSYRLVLHAKPSSAVPSREVTVDAPALTMADGAQSIAMKPDGNCRYQLANGGELSVTKAGVGVVRFPQAGGAIQGGLLLPRQTLDAQALAGEWNALGFAEVDQNPAVTDLVLRTIVVDPDGKLAGGTSCSGDDYYRPLATCTTSAVSGQVLRADASGGFSLNDATGRDLGQRLFAYRGVDRDPMWVLVDAAGTFVVGTRKRSLDLPTLGQVVSARRLELQGGFTAPLPVGDYKSTVLSVSASNGAYEQRGSIDSMESTSPYFGYFNAREEISINTPAPGFATRAWQFQCCLVNGEGGANTFGGWSGAVILPITGMDIALKLSRFRSSNEGGSAFLIAVPGI